MRMPLSVGAGAALSLAIAMCGVGPIEWTVTWIARIAAAAWADGDLKSGLLYGGGLVLFGGYGLSQWLPHVRAAWRRRPSDVVITEDGLAISGGMHDGLLVAWNELGEPRTLEAARKLRLAVRGTHYDLAESTNAYEDRSVAALRGAIESTSYARSEPKVDVEQAFGCDHCGAPVTPVDDERATCGYCQTDKPVAPALRERIRAATTVRDTRPRVEKLVTKLLKQPGAESARRRLIAAGVLMALAWVATYALYYRQAWTADVVRFGTLNAIWLFPYATIAGLFLVLRASLVDRFALGLLTLGFGARKGPGGTPVCHECAAALPPAAEHVVVRCVFCKTDNVMGIDLRDTAQRASGEKRTLEATLRTRTRARLLWGVGGLILAVPVLGYAKDLFVEGTEKATFTKVIEPANKGKQIWDVGLAMRMPAATRDNEQMLIIVQAAEAAEPYVGVASLSEGAPRPQKLWSAKDLRDPTWLDADRYLVVAREGDEDVLHLASLKKGRIRVVHRAPGLARPSVARDENRVVLAQNEDETWQLVLIHLDGGEAPRVLAQGRDPAWHPLEDVIAYVSDDRIWWLRLADSKPQNLIKSDDYVYRDPAWSPCGGWLVFGSNEGWDRYEDGRAEATSNLVAITWSLKHAKRTETQWWTLTEGSAAATKPSWDTFGIWFQTDQYGEDQIFQARLGLRELWANPNCPWAK